jgi:glycosyltransferase involved in cell wall biosynthesis
VPEIVVEGETGYLFAPGQPEDLAAKVIDLLENPLKARVFGQAGRQRLLERFGSVRNAELTMALYAKLLD